MKQEDKEIIIQGLSNSKIQDILYYDLNMLDETGYCLHTPEEIFRAAVEWKSSKDLPVWRKRNDFSYPKQFVGVLITGGDTTTLPVLVADGYEVPIKDLLEKLPKEE